MIALRFTELSGEFGARGTSCAHERVCLCATAVCGKVAGSVQGLRANNDNDMVCVLLSVY